jgi:site-specific DNA recombinase
MSDGGIMKAAIYLRVSTEEQRERQSIQNQRDFADQYCHTNGISIADWYADDGVSGTVPLPLRDQGARLAEDARQGRFDTVLVYKLDRLGRDPRMILNAVAELEACGARLLSMTEPFDTKDPSGRFMLTVLSGVAGFERDNILQRSREGTNRLAREGAWLGGIVPYGYRVEGKKRDARLVVSDAPVPGCPFSESGVVRQIYELSGQEGKSCFFISEHLNQLGVPPVYVRDGRTVHEGKRERATAGVWRAARIRNLLVSTVYKGVHQYGKRSKGAREVIERPVPAIVDESLWSRAQDVLRRNMLFSARNARRKYLLRGLAKCGLCGLTYIGTAYPTSNARQKVYYVCNGKQNDRGIYGVRGQRCPSKSISGDIEDVVWRDIEGFLRDPGPVLGQLRKRMVELRGKSKGSQEEVLELGRLVQGKNAERDRVLALYRRGRIKENVLDKQLDEIGVEEEALQNRIQQLKAEADGAQTAEAGLDSTAAMLRELNLRLDEPLTWELRRQLVELLVESVRVDTIEPEGKRDSRVTVTYRFAGESTSTASRTGVRVDFLGIRESRASARRGRSSYTGRD